MTAPVHPRTRPDFVLSMATWVCLALFAGLLLTYVSGGPDWLLALLRWASWRSAAVLVIAYAMRYAYRRGARAADEWYEPRLDEIRAAVSALAAERSKRPTVADHLHLAAAQRKRLRELNDRVQSADFWGRSL